MSIDRIHSQRVNCADPNGPFQSDLMQEYLQAVRDCAERCHSIPASDRRPRADASSRRRMRHRHPQVCSTPTPVRRCRRSDRSTGRDMLPQGFAAYRRCGVRCRIGVAVPQDRSSNTRGPEKLPITLRVGGTANKQDARNSGRLARTPAGSAARECGGLRYPAGRQAERAAARQHDRAQQTLNTLKTAEASHRQAVAMEWRGR